VAAVGRRWKRIFGRGALPAGHWLALALAAALLADLGLSAHATEPEKFDHARTRFPLTGAHARTSCESCHVSGQMAGTPMTCAACHGGNGSRAVTVRPASHIPTSQA